MCYVLTKGSTIVAYDRQPKSERKPNAETIEAIREVELMKADRNMSKRYTDIDEMMRDLLA